MEKAIYKRYTVLISLALTILAGCGESPKQPTPIRRTGDGANLNSPRKPGEDQPPAPPKNNPPESKDRPRQDLPSEAEIKAKSEKIGKMSAEVKQKAQGSPLAASQFQEGLYNLEELYSQFEYFDSSRGDDVMLLNKSTVEYVSDSMKLNKVGNEGVGLMSNGIDIGRQLIVPYKFIVKAQEGQAWKPKRDQSASEVLLKTYAEPRLGTMSLYDLFQNGADAVQQVSLIEALGSTQGLVDKEIGYEASDSTGKKIMIRPRQNEQGKLILLVTILEQGASAQSSATTMKYMRRTLVFVYHRKALSE